METNTQLRIVEFRLIGKFGHFQKAEGATAAMTYLIPPRTVILGLIGAVLGMPKDAPQVLLESAAIAISGKVPETFWHKVKFRKNPPAALPSRITAQQAGSSSDEKTALFYQEWLFRPSYSIYVSLPTDYQDEFEWRLDQRRWHFQPCLGISELSADLELVSTGIGERRSPGAIDLSSVAPADSCVLDLDSIFARGAVIKAVLMPQSLNADRVFHHRRYYIEREGKPIPVTTGSAYYYKDRYLVFL